MIARIVTLLLWAVFKTAAYEGAPMSPLSKGGVTNQALASTASYTIDVETSGTDWIVVQANLTGAASGDLTVTVTPYDDDGVTLGTLNLTPNPTQGPTFSGGAVRSYGKYDVTGIGRVRITAKNNNAGAQTLTRLTWRTQGF